MMMKTAASTVEKDSTQSYFHLAYVKMPAIITKKEYHRRVSPKVLKGGREREIHNEAMNEANTSRPRQQSETAKTYFFLKGAKATAEPAAKSRMADTAKYMKWVQVIVFSDLRLSVPL